MGRRHRLLAADQPLPCQQNHFGSEDWETYSGFQSLHWQLFLPVVSLQCSLASFLDIIASLLENVQNQNLQQGSFTKCYDVLFHHLLHSEAITLKVN